MRLYLKPFNYGFFHVLFLIGSALKYPQFWIVNKILSQIRETSAEREWRIHEGPCYERGCIMLFSMVFGGVFVILLIPFTIIGYFLWLFALRYRNPFLYSTNCGKYVDNYEPLLLAGKNVSVFSLNAKLLPESRSRTFNLANVQKRASQIASILVHSSSAGQGKISGEPSYAGKSSFAVGYQGDSISQVSYGYLDKSAGYDNFSENRSLISGNAVEISVSGPPVPPAASGDSYSVGAGAGSNVSRIKAADQITVTSLKSVEGMWQRRVNNHEKTDSCITLKSDVPLKQHQQQLTPGNGIPGSSYTLESCNSESRSRVSEANPSTMSISSKFHGIPALPPVQQNGSVVLSNGSGSNSERARLSQQQQLSPDATDTDVQPAEQPARSPSGNQTFLSVQQQRVATSVSQAVNETSTVTNDLPSVGFSSIISIPSDCPASDVLCLQEVSDNIADEIVSRRLLTAFPHVLHSAKRYHGFRSCPVTVGNLLIASKFPILSARYHELLTNFGKKCLLIAKVLLHHSGDQRVVAIVGNVYVKRKTPLSILEPGDFDDIVKWLRSFRNDTMNVDANDILGLDVCTGYVDLPADGSLVNDIFQHDFFTSYLSPSMNISGELFGAELEPSVVHEAEVKQPESLNHTLFRYHPTGPRLSQLFRSVADVAGETAPFSLMKSSFLRYCQDTPDMAAVTPTQQGKQTYWQANSSKGKVTTAFAGLTTHLGLNASFINSSASSR